MASSREFFRGTPVWIIFQQQWHGLRSQPILAVSFFYSHFTSSVPGPSIADDNSASQ
jgi:hypothetical protein